MTVGIGSSPPNALNKTKQEGFQDWLSAFDNLLSSWYTDPANEQDDIDRIYRQEEAQEWLDLLEAYGRGEVEYNTLINWQPDFLRDIEGFNDYIADVRFQATWERNANYNIAYCEENGCRDEAMQRFYDKWIASGSPDSKDGMWSDEQFDEWLAEQPEDPVGPVDPGPEPPQTLDEMLSELAEEQQVDRDVVDGVVDMIETIKGSIPTDLESASDLIKGVLSSTVLGSALEECESWTGNTTTEGGKGVPSWTKCVDVGIFGIPGLDLPLPPGMVDISTSVYDIIQKGEDIGESFEDFLEDPSGWLENVIDKAVEKVQDVWGDLQAGVDPKTIGGLSGILNDWIGNILGGYILGQVKDATSAIDPFLYAGDCLDPTFKEANKEYCEDALNQGTLVDCSTFNKTGDLVTSADQCGPCQNPDFTPTGANGECVDPDPNDCAGQNKSINSDGSCGECLGSLKEIGGECVEPCQYNDTIAASSPECKEPWTDGGDTEAECTAQGRLHVPGDASTETESSCGGCLPTHTEEAGECTEWADGGPTQEECESQGKVHRPSTGTGRDSSCGGCLDGYELVNGQCTEEGLEEPCPGNQIRNEETRECEDPGPDFVEGDPCTTEDGKAGTYDSEGICIPDWVNPGPSVQDCEALGKTHVSGDPSEQKASECGGCKNPQWNDIGEGGACVAPVECWDGSTKPTEAECPEEPPKLDCASKNRIQEDEYTCGGCLNDTFEEKGGECVEKVCDESSFQEEVVETTTIPYGQGQPRVQAPTYTEVNGVCTKTTYEVIVADPTQQQCEAEGKALSEDGKTCVEPTPCTNGATLESGCEQCEDGSSPSDYEGGKCGGKLIVTPETCGPETFTAERTVEASVGSGEVKDPTVEYMVENGECTKVTIVYVAGPVMPQVCGPDTVANTVNLTETLPYGSTLPAPQTTYGDVDGVCTATVTTYVAGPPNCTEITEVNYEDCGYVQCPEGSVEPYATSSGECYDPVQPCEDPNRIQNEDGSCSDQCNGDLVLQDQGNGSFLCGEPPCGPNTVDQQVEQNVVIPFGEPLPESQTSYEDDGTQCVATTVTYTQGPEPQDCASQGRQQTDEFTCGECLPEYQAEGDRCIPKEQPDCASLGRQQVDIYTCGECLDTHKLEGDECIPKEQPDCASQFREQTDVYTCGECLEGYTLADDEVTCRPKTCEDSNAKNYGEIGACGECEAGYSRDPENPDSLCTADTTVVDPEPDPDPEPCPDGRPRDAEGNCPGPVVVEDPCDDAIYALENPGECGEEETCENGATDYPECTQCADGSLPDANLGCGGNDTCENGATDWPLCSECPDGTPTDPDTPCGGPDCTDPEYAAANPEECGTCVDCTCPEYAAANPEECLPSPPPPPEGGGGGGGAGGQEKREPIEFGISADPELLARKQFPITDYLSGLFTGNR